MREMDGEERDRLAEACHTEDWYIGDATGQEWMDAYAAVDGR